MIFACRARTSSAIQTTSCFFSIVFPFKVGASPRARQYSLRPLASRRTPAVNVGVVLRSWPEVVSGRPGAEQLDQFDLRLLPRCRVEAHFQGVVRLTITRRSGRHKAELEASKSVSWVRQFLADLGLGARGGHPRRLKRGRTKDPYAAGITLSCCPEAIQVR